MFCSRPSVRKLTDCNVTVLICFKKYHSCNILPCCLDLINVKNKIFGIFAENRLIIEKT